jgi:hypothetical protein
MRRPRDGPLESRSPHLPLCRWRQCPIYHKSSHCPSPGKEGLFLFCRDGCYLCKISRLGSLTRSAGYHDRNLTSSTTPTARNILQCTNKPVDLQWLGSHAHSKARIPSPMIRTSLDRIQMFGLMIYFAALSCQVTSRAQMRTDCIVSNRYTQCRFCSILSSHVCCLEINVLWASDSWEYVWRIAGAWVVPLRQLAKKAQCLVSDQTPKLIYMLNLWQYVWSLNDPASKKKKRPCS